MRIHIIRSAVALGCAAMIAGVGGRAMAQDEELRPRGQESFGPAQRQAQPCPLQYFPVRAPHDTGYQNDPSPANQALWDCGGANSNSDYNRGPSCDVKPDHRGVDVWASEGAPVVAPVSGTVVQVGFDNDPGNQVRIRDACGWSHYLIHLKSIEPGITQGSSIKAGTVIGSVGNTGVKSNKVIHLHYSLYPGEDYCAAINPHSFLKAVENDVCDVPKVCGNTVCGPDSFCSGGNKCCPNKGTAPGCPQ